MPGTRQVRKGLAARDRGDHENLRVRSKGRVEAGAAADVVAVDEDVDEPPELAVLVEAEVPNRQGTQGVAERRRFALELALPARLAGEQRGEPDYGHSAVSTERTGGSQRAASCHDSPPSGEASTEPVCVPK